MNPRNHPSYQSGARNKFIYSWLDELQEIDQDEREKYPSHQYIKICHTAEKEMLQLTHQSWHPRAFWSFWSYYFPSIIDCL
jgi:hypothetical protein